MPNENASGLTLKVVLFGLALAVAGALIASGVALVFAPAGLVVAGVELAAWSWLVLADDGPGGAT